MTGAKRVKLRYESVVAEWLAENANMEDPLGSAKALAAAMHQAGLMTVIRDDLKAFMRASRSERS